MQKSSFVRVENGKTLQSCNLCKQYKELTSSFHKDKKEPLGFMKWCKQCRKDIQAAKPKARKRYYKLNDAGELVERECTSCRAVLPSDHFHNHSVCPGGKDVICKPCKNIECVEYRDNNKDKVRKVYREYYQRNRPTIKANVKRWREANRDKCVDYDKRINRNVGIHKAFSKEMRKLKQFIKKENAEAPSNKDKYCLDHIIPLKHPNVSGLNVPWNVQFLPWSENSCKSNKFDGTYDNDSWREDYLHYLTMRSQSHE